MAVDKRKRELIEPTKGNKRYVRRDDAGRFTESVDVTRSLRTDVKKQAQHASRRGHGDEGDRSRSKAK